MESEQTVLDGYSDLEKGAYLGAIASLATADHVASDEEIGHIRELCDAARLSEIQKEYVIRAATELTGKDLERCLDVLKNSRLRYSLVTDLIAFAKSDGSYTPDEERNISNMAKYLGLDSKQFSLLDQFTDKASEAKEKGQEVSDPSFLASGGMKNKMQDAGIDTGSLFKGLLGIAGPMILAGMLSGGMGRRRSMFGGGMMGGSMMGGGLGSIIGMMSGGRVYRNSGGLLGRMFGGRGFGF